MQIKALILVIFSSMIMNGWQKTTTEQARSTFHDCNFRTEKQNWRLARTAHAQ